jgi:hypothetical protein
MMRKIKTCDVTDRYVRHLVELFFLSKYVFHFDRPEEIIKEFSDMLVKHTLEKVSKIDDVEIQYSFMRYPEMYIDDFFEVNISPPSRPDHVTEKETLETI